MRKLLNLLTTSNMQFIVPEAENNLDILCRDKNIEFNVDWIKIKSKATDTFSNLPTYSTGTNKTVRIKVNIVLIDDITCTIEALIRLNNDITDKIIDTITIDEIKNITHRKDESKNEKTSY